MVRPIIANHRSKLLQHGSPAFLASQTNCEAGAGTTTSQRACRDPCLRPCATSTKESGGAVRRAKEPDRIAPPAPVPHEVRPRTVLPGCGGTKHQTASPVLE